LLRLLLLLGLLLRGIACASAAAIARLAGCLEGLRVAVGALALAALGWIGRGVIALLAALWGRRSVRLVLLVWLTGWLLELSSVEAGCCCEGVDSRMVVRQAGHRVEVRRSFRLLAQPPFSMRAVE
jgi:hypothetical protein